MSFGRIRLFGVLCLGLPLVWGCGGDSGGAERASEPAMEAPEQAEAREPGALSEGEAPDSTLAARGEELFRSKGCVACHTLGGGRLVGPDLQGVTRRRELAWIRSMIVNPDSMLQNDATAKELLAEYFTPMTNMQVKPDEAWALIHFLSREAEAAAPSSGN